MRAGRQTGRVRLLVTKFMGKLTLKHLDPRALLGRPLLYRLVQRLLGSSRGTETYVARHLRPKPNMQVLDIGCGTADILRLLDDVVYVGFDPAGAYVEAARARFGERGTFHVGSVEEPPAAVLGRRFDLLMANGVLHHVNDEVARSLFAFAREHLAAEGRVVTIDPVVVHGQAWLARRLIEGDRGGHVRDSREYEGLARAVFEEVTATVHHDLLRVPYTHLIMECAEPRPNRR